MADDTVEEGMTMKQSKKNVDGTEVTRRGFLKTILPGLFAVGVVGSAGSAQPPADGAYGNGPYGGVIRKPDTK